MSDFKETLIFQFEAATSQQSLRNCSQDQIVYFIDDIFEAYDRRRELDIVSAVLEVHQMQSSL
jgi:hypothetical protein